MPSTMVNGNELFYDPRPAETSTTSTNPARQVPGFPFGFGGAVTTGNSSNPLTSLTPSTLTPTANAGGVPNNLADITNLINSLNRAAQQAANAARIPGGSDLEAQSTANIGSELKGEVPADVVRMLAQQAAERGVATGAAGSPNSMSAYLRALGLTSLGQQATGQSNLTSALARNPGAPIYDPTGQVLTPYQSGTLTNESNRIAQQQAEAAANRALQQQQLDLQRWQAQQQQANADRTYQQTYGPKQYGNPRDNPMNWSRDMFGNSVFTSKY